MLAATSLPTREEREAALALLPGARQLFELAGFVRGALINQSVGFIDAALGPNHTRAALVALQEGLDVLLQAMIDLVNSSLSETVLSRVELADPLALGDPLPEGEGERIPIRAARFALEDSAVRSASAGDHLVNAYLRLAYEANAASVDEVARCEFRPEELDPRWWADVETARRGLAEIASSTGVVAPILPSFELTADFETYASTAAVVDARSFRDVVIHRERPSYREAPGIGRVTAWREGEITFQNPPSAEELAALPTLGEQRALVADAIDATHVFAERVWDLALRFLASVDVFVRLEGREVRITTTHRIGLSDPEHPRPILRQHRDPSSFLQ